MFGTSPGMTTKGRWDSASSPYRFDRRKRVVGRPEPVPAKVESTMTRGTDPVRTGYAPALPGTPVDLPRQAIDMSIQKKASLQKKNEPDPEHKKD